MNNMKKLKIALSLLFALTFSLFLVACGGNEGKEVSLIELGKGMKTEFIEGDSFSSEGLTVTVYYRGSDEAVVLEPDQYEVDYPDGFEDLTPGTYTVVVTPEQTPAANADPVTASYNVTISHNWIDDGDGNAHCECGAKQVTYANLTDTVTTVAWGNQATLTEKSENSPAKEPIAGENHVNYGVLVPGQTIELTMKILEVDTGAIYNTPLMGIRNGVDGLIPREDSYVIGTCAGFSTPDGGTKDAAPQSGTASTSTDPWVVYKSGSAINATDLVGGTVVVSYEYSSDSVMTIRHTLTKSDNSTLTQANSLNVPRGSYEIVAYGEKVTYQVTQVVSIMNSFVEGFTAEPPTATVQPEGKLFNTEGLTTAAEMSDGTTIENSYNAYAMVDVVAEDGTTTPTRMALANTPLSRDMYDFYVEFAGETFYFTSTGEPGGDSLIKVVASEFASANAAAVVANGELFDASNATFDYAVNDSEDGIVIVGAGTASVLTDAQKEALDTTANAFVSFKLGALSETFDTATVEGGYASFGGGVVEVVLPTGADYTLVLSKSGETVQEVQRVAVDLSGVQTPAHGAYLADSTFTLDAGGEFTVVYTDVEVSDDYTLVAGGMPVKVSEVKAGISAEGEYTVFAGQLWITAAEQTGSDYTVTYRTAGPDLVNLSSTNATTLVALRDADGETLAEYTYHYDMVFSDEVPATVTNLVKISDDTVVLVQRDKLYVFRAVSADAVAGKLEYSQLYIDATLNIQNDLGEPLDVSVSSSADGVKANDSNTITLSSGASGKLVAMGNVGDASDYDYGALVVYQFSVTALGLREEDVAETFYFTANEDTANGQETYTVYTVTGNEIASEVVTPTGERTETQAFSCVSDGIEVYTDENGFRYGAIVTPATGVHSFGEFVDDVATCSVCGATNTRIAIDENSYYEIIVLSKESADTIANNDDDPNWWAPAGSIPSSQKAVTGDFAVQYFWTNTRDINWYQDVVLELTDGTNTFDMNFFMSATFWGSLWAKTDTATLTTTVTCNDETATLPAQPTTDSFEGNYNATIVRIGSTVTITQVAELTSGDVWKVVDVFTGFTTAPLTAQITGNPYWVDDLKVTVGEVNTVIDYAGDVNNKTVGAITSALGSGISVSATITNHDGDWGTHVIKTAGNMIVALPNLDPFNSTTWQEAGYPQCNAFPNSIGTDDLVGEGAAWNCFFNATTPYYLTVSVSVEDGVKFYRDGELMIWYKADRTMVGEVTVADFCEFILNEIVESGFTFMAATGTGAVTTDLHVGAALSDAQAQAQYEAQLPQE